MPPGTTPHLKIAEKDRGQYCCVTVSFLFITIQDTKALIKILHFTVYSFEFAQIYFRPIEI